MKDETLITVLIRDPACSDWLRTSGPVRVLRRPDLEVAKKARNIFVLTLASELVKVADFVREASRRHHLRALLVHADLDLRWIGQILDRADLRTLRTLLVHWGSDLPRRILAAWRMGAQDELIADAVALPDRMLVLTCALERMEVPFDCLPALAELSSESLKRFEVASDGSYLHWPEMDVHLDLDAFRVAVDPRAREQAMAERLRHSRRTGQAVFALRKQKGFRQADIPGLSARQIRRIESGEFFPRSATLQKLAGAHDMSLSEYLDALARLARADR